MKNHQQLLLEYLKSQNFMTLATDNKKLWVSSVYYVVDDNFNIYFLSEPQSKHCQDLILNNTVACNVADSRQKVTAKKIGAQIQGRAFRVNNLEQIKWTLSLWNKINPGFESIINLRNIKLNKINSRIYKVKPQVIKFFNEKLYGPEGFEIFRFK